MFLKIDLTNAAYDFITKRRRVLQNKVESL